MGLNFDGKGTAVAPVDFAGNTFGGQFAAFNVNVQTGGMGGAAGAGTAALSPVVLAVGALVLLLILKRKRKG